MRTRDVIRKFKQYLRDHCVFETTKLPPEFKKNWIKALQSGEYNQTTGVLHDGRGFCCLGVACAIAGHNLNKLTRHNVPKKNHKIPKLLKDGSSTVRHFVFLNDTINATFNQIADIIEQFY